MIKDSRIIEELRQENERLKKANYLLRFDALPKQEQEWALRGFEICRWLQELTPSEIIDFKVKYMEKYDDELPF